MKTILEILTFPLRLILYCLKPIFRFFIKDEIEYEKKKYSELLLKYQEKSNTLKKTAKELEKLNKIFNRIETIFKHYKKWNFEISKTKKNETVFIFHNDSFDIFYLCGLNGNHHNNDCRINLNDRDDILKIDDLISNTSNQGYARTLLEFTIKKAEEKNIKEIYGDLAPVDANEFKWLIPFYESLGFKCTLFKDENKRMDGEIRMKINTTANKV